MFQFWRSEPHYRIWVYTSPPREFHTVSFMSIFFWRSGITSERSVNVTYGLSQKYQISLSTTLTIKHNIIKETRLYSPTFLNQSMLLLGQHIPFLHQVLQLIGPEAILACHYNWLPNTLPVLKQHPILHNLHLLLLSGTTLRIYRNCWFKFSYKNTFFHFYSRSNLKFL